MWVQELDCVNKVFSNQSEDMDYPGRAVWSHFMFVFAFLSKPFLIFRLILLFEDCSRIYLHTSKLKKNKHFSHTLLQHYFSVCTERSVLAAQ